VEGGTDEDEQNGSGEECSQVDICKESLENKTKLITRTSSASVSAEEETKKKRSEDGKKMDIICEKKKRFGGSGLPE
jgi:hypothetical protein